MALTTGSGLGLGRHLALGCLLLASSAGCKRDDYAQLIATSFEEQGEAARVVSKDQAYSGEFSVKAAGLTDTMRIRYPVQALGMVERVRLSAQVWLTHSPTKYPPLVIEIWRNGASVYTKYLRLNEIVWRYDQWVPVTTLLQLPPLESKDQLRLSLTLNQPDAKAYLDDLTIDNAQ